jgi:hypothetical protein
MLLVVQVCQFSRMYQKSVCQQNLPVTIFYPEMVPKFSHTLHLIQFRLMAELIFGFCNPWLLIQLRQLIFLSLRLWVPIRRMRSEKDRG